MNSVKRILLALAAPAFLLLTCAGAWASDLGEHKGGENSLLVVADSPAGLPFAVAGTMTAPPTRFAVISMVGPEGKAGAQMLASEGAVVAQYRVVSIHPDRVVFEREGHTFFVRVGIARQDAPAQGAALQYAPKRTAPLTVIAPPSSIEAIRKQTGAFVDLLKANPEFQKGLDERLRRVREMEGASQPPTRP